MAIFGEFMASMMGGAMPGGASEAMANPDMMKMLGGFTILRLTGMLGMAADMGGEKKGPIITKDQLLAINAKLNEIPKA